MNCAWHSFIHLLPAWMRESVDKQGSETLEELRLRLGQGPQLVMNGKSVWLQRKVSDDDLHFCVNIASKYSPWATDTVKNGYITAPGGHRIGLCGQVVNDNGRISGMQRMTSLCLRVARDFPGIAKAGLTCCGSVLLIGRPGSGKTTFLRDLIRQKSNAESERIAVIDERQEIFPHVHGQWCFPIGKQTDVLSGCQKAYGIETVLRSMGPGVIALDEITAQEDCKALLHAGWCGVKLIATAHAGCKEDLYNRPVYRPIIDTGLFDTLVIMRPDKSWYTERISLCYSK